MSSVGSGVSSRRKKASIESRSIHVIQSGKRAASVCRNPQKGRDRISASTVYPSTDSIVVAVNAAKITRHALEWALTNVVQSGDHITLLALWPGGRKLWNLPIFSGDCARVLRKNGKSHELEEEINDMCSSMMQELHLLCNAKKAKVSVKVVPNGGREAIAVVAQQTEASWVVLDRQLKMEGKICMEQLRCNLVLVSQSGCKVLRLNLKGSSRRERGREGETQAIGKDCEVREDASRKKLISFATKGKANRRPLPYSSDASSCGSSPDVETPFTATETGTSSACSHATSPPPSDEPRVLSLPESKLACAVDSTDQDDHLARLPEPEDVSNGDGDCLSHLYGDHDSLSEFQVDHSGPLCTPASGSPDDPEGIFDRSFLMATEPWLETTFLEGSFFREPWKPASFIGSRPNSANTTPKSEFWSTPTRSIDPKQGRASRSPSPTNATPPNSSRGMISLDNSRVGARAGSPQSMVNGGGSSSTTRRKEIVRCSRQPLPDGDVDRSRGGSSASCRRVATTRELLEKFSEWDHRGGAKLRSSSSSSALLHQVELGDGDLERTSSLRKAMALGRHHAPLGPPPLCSICQHQAPVFGKPPRRFSFAELELATGGFSKANFLAEGGFGSVHRGVLPDGQAVAVKQHKLASSQGDIEFCSEVEVLSCAQHRNVVMLIGYCVEERRRLLVYEFICNRSLDAHLYGSDREPLLWASRQKIAVGAARGLRYLHEECRVGCIIHRDLRPNNILLTHDFEPMVGDFGLARWQPDGDLGVQTRVIGTFGYLAPEYAQSGQVTEKADVYSFGVVLLELATGRKAVDITRPKGQQCLTEWARPLLEEGAMQEQMDPRLEGQYAEYEAYCMLHAAALCIRREAERRPRMSQVLRILEGDMVIDNSGCSTPCYYYAGARAAAAEDWSVTPPYDGSRSSRICAEDNGTGSVSPPLISHSGSLLLRHPVAPPPAAKLSYQALKAAYVLPHRLSFDDS